MKDVIQESLSQEYLTSYLEIDTPNSTIKILNRLRIPLQHLRLACGRQELHQSIKNPNIHYTIVNSIPNNHHNYNYVRDYIQNLSTNTYRSYKFLSSLTIEKLY